MSDEREEDKGSDLLVRGVSLAVRSKYGIILLLAILAPLFVIFAFGLIGGISKQASASCLGGGSLASTITGAKNVLATDYGGPQDPSTPSDHGAFGSLNGTAAFAELSTDPFASPLDFSALGIALGGSGPLAPHTLLRITNPPTGKTLVAEKLDEGAGGPQHPQIDLWWQTALALGFPYPGSGDVVISPAEPGDVASLTPIAGGIGPSSAVQFASTGVASGTCGGTPTGSYAGLVSPFVHQYIATLANTDQGVDFGTQQGIQQGDPILAIGNSTLTEITTFYQGQPGMWFQFDQAGQQASGYWGWYVAEQIVPKIPANQAIQAGTAVCTYAPSGTGIEIGWAAAPGVTATQRFHPSEVPTRHDGNGTTDGRAFLNFLVKVHAIR